MSIDAPTMALFIAIMQVACGVLLIYASFHYRDGRAGVWWGVSHIILAAGVGLSIVGGITGLDWVTACAFVVFIGCAASQWHGTRLLTDAPTHLGLLLLGPILIGLINLAPVGTALPMVRGIAASVLNIAYFAGAIYALLRPRSGPLSAYKPLAVLFSANIVALALGPFGGLGSSEGGLPPLFSFGGLIYVEGQLFVLGTTIFIVAALREKRERAQYRAAATDSLTDLPNRRSFFETCSGVVARCIATDTPFTVVLIDLDRFKSVNDRFGHAVGDEVLRVFAEVGRKSLRTNDVIGRIGGEEFALLLYGSSMDAALAIADRMRRAFETAAKFVDGQPVGATFSAGLATSSSTTNLDALLKEADNALYQAKGNGRNRVECLRDALPPTPNRIARVA